jgi:hypothetical protein
VGIDHRALAHDIHRDLARYRGWKNESRQFLEYQNNRYNRYRCGHRIGIVLVISIIPDF